MIQRIMNGDWNSKRRKKGQERMKTVFLGGTCNESKWRERLIPLLKIGYFNPVVPHWDDDAAAKEIAVRQKTDFCLYVISPKMTGFYSVAEVVDDSNKQPNKTVFCFVTEEDGMAFTPHQLKSLEQIGKMVVSNGAAWLKDLEDVARYLNTYC
jgi:hypothetical protein